MPSLRVPGIYHLESRAYAGFCIWIRYLYGPDRSGISTLLPAYVVFKNDTPE